MSNSGFMNLVVLLALAIGIGGLALGVHSYMYIADQEEDSTKTGIHRTYFDNVSASYIGPLDSWADIPNLSIDFQVEAGEKVYFLFTCSALVGQITGYNEMVFGGTIDGDMISAAICTIGQTGGTSPPDMMFSVAIQHTLDSLSAGTHTLKFQTYRGADGSIADCNLLVQTYT